MSRWFFTSDLHGSLHRYHRLKEAIWEFRPPAVLLGGDLLPPTAGQWTTSDAQEGDFLAAFLMPELQDLQHRMGSEYPRILLILGNDDLRIEEDALLRGQAAGLWHYLQGRRVDVDGFEVFGYAYVPPTPFLWKDWEKYDVSRYVPPGCVSPEEGWRTVEVTPHEARYGTIREDLEELAGSLDLSQAVFLFHTPPYETILVRAALDGKMVDHVPLDLHVGSIAVRRFIEARQPLLTLHGHIHESPRLTGSWRDRIGKTHTFTGAHDGPELALIRFDPEALEEATRILV
jgi:Icc-related predicted phosphoesterase